MATTALPSSLPGTARADGVDSPLAYATVLFLGLVAGTQMVDRGLLAMLSPAIQASFGASDAWMGALHGVAGILVASLLAVPLARLADDHSRRLILLGFVGAWSALTLLAACAPNFWLFFMGRAAAGITEFALIPVVYSMIPDLVSEKRRVLANLAFAAIMAAGASAGYFFGGAILNLAVSLTAAFPDLLQPFETWRTAMFLLSLLGLPLVLLGLATMDPPRVRAAAEAVTGSLLAYARTNAALLIGLIGAAGCIAIAVQGLMPLIVMALTRRFPSDLGAIGETLGLLLLVTNFTSLAIAGTLDRVLLPYLRQMGRPLVMASGAALSVPFIAGLMAVSSAEAALWLVGGFLLTTCIANALIPTIIQDIVPGELRARAFAVYSVVISIFCAIGPVMMGALSDRVLGNDLLSAIIAIALPSLALAALGAAIGARSYPKGTS